MNSYSVQINFSVFFNETAKGYKGIFNPTTGKDW